MSRPAARLRTVVPGSGRAALGATVAGGVLTALASAPERAGRLFRRRFPTVAVTGMTGVGKTQLADRLAGRSPSSGVAEVGSAVMERRTRRSPRMHGFRFLVVPGDNAATRLGALDEVFHDEPVDGVVHVVANGYATPRRTAIEAIRCAVIDQSSSSATSCCSRVAVAAPVVPAVRRGVA